MENTKKAGGEEASQSATAGIVTRNIKALVARRRKEENDKPLGERFADAVTRFVGRMSFVYVHIVIFAGWILANSGWLNLKPFDTDFTGLQLATQIEAIFLSTFVLMSQNSLDAQADKRADLDLQISLLSEHEITKLLSLVSAIAHKLQVDEAKNPELTELAKDVLPEKVMDTMEEERKGREKVEATI
jgi:uncharacterized membrane protein